MASLLLGLFSLMDRRFEGSDTDILISAVLATGAYAWLFLLLVIACMTKQPLIVIFTFC